MIPAAGWKILSVRHVEYECSVLPGALMVNTEVMLMQGFTGIELKFTGTHNFDLSKHYELSLKEIPCQGR